MTFGSLIFATLFVISFFAMKMLMNWSRDRDGKLVPPEELSKKLDSFPSDNPGRAIFFLFSLIALIAVILSHS